MGLFNRKKAANDDINDYYASERRQRVGMAWLLGLATLVLTVLLALGLFYGGRWVYRTVFNDDQPTNQTQQDVSADNDSDDTNGLLDNISIGESDENTTDNDTSTETTDESTNTDDGTNSQTSTSQDLPSSGPNELPSTGPSGPEELR